MIKLADDGTIDLALHSSVKVFLIDSLRHEIFYKRNEAQRGEVFMTLEVVVE